VERIYGAANARAYNIAASTGCTALRNNGGCELLCAPGALPVHGVDGNAVVLRCLSGKYIEYNEAARCRFAAGGDGEWQHVSTDIFIIYTIFVSLSR
jgi:hypothetical protein